MIPLLLGLLLLQDPSAWKAKNVAIVVQHSGAHRSMNTAITSMLQRILALRPETSEVTLIGFERDFEQLEGTRFRRKPAVLQARTSDAEAIREAVAGMVFHGPSPVYDAVILAVGEKPERIVLFSNGMDNASIATFDEMEEAARKNEVPVSTVYLPANPPAGGDSRMKKLSKATGGKFIDLRERNNWDLLVAALR